MKVKVMNYNIWHGFHQDEAPFALQEERLKAAQKIVKEVNPDILVLTEAAYGGPNPYGIFIDYQKLFEYPYAFFSSTDITQEGGNCVLSRFPLEAETIPLLNRTALRAKIDLGSKILNIDVFHPHPTLTEDQKIEAIKPLFSRIEGHYILTGDFNAVSDEDYYDREKMIAAFSKFEKDPERVVDEFLKRKLIPYIKAQGLKDAFSLPTRRFTIPTSVYGPNKDSAMRIDYFFISHQVKPAETEVITGDLAEIASDHYPIVGVFEII